MKRFGILFLLLSSIAYSSSITTPSTTPATSSVDNGIVRYNGTSGNTIKNQTIVTIDDFGNISGIHGVAYTWPGSQGAASTCLKNDGAGALTWGTCGGGGGGSGTVTQVNTGGNLTGGPITTTGTVSLVAVPQTDGYIANEGSYPDHGFLFAESGNDTGFTSPSDGVIYQLGNSSIGSKWADVGPTEIHGVPIVFPSTQGAASSVMTNDGSGNLSWGAIPPLALPQNLTESFDTANASSTRFNIQSALAPVADSSGTNVNELQVYTDNYAAFPINGVTSINVGNQNLGSANIGYNHIFNAGQTIGNGTDPITTGEVRGALFNTHVQNASTATSVIGVEQTLGVDVGGTVGAFQGFKTSGTIDHITGGVEHDLAQKNITTADGFVHGFIAGDHVGTAKSDVASFLDQTTIDSMPTRNTGYNSISIGPTVTNSGTTVGGFTEISAHSNVAGHVINDASLIEAGESFGAIDRNLNYMNLHPNITSVGGNANGYNDGTHITSVSNGSYTGINVNPQIDSLANNYLGMGINARAAEASPSAFNFTVTPVADVAGSLAGKSFTFGQAYVDGGNTYTPWYKVSGVGTVPTCCGSYIEIDISTGATAATIATATVAAINGSGAPFGATITVTDLGGSFSIVSSHNGAANPFSPQDSGFSAAYTTHGAGNGTATGLQINMSNATGFSTIPRAIDISEGTINSQLNTPIATESNPTTVNNIGVNFGAAASSTIANADQIGFGTPSFVNVGNGSTITSGAFGVGTAANGGFILNQIGTGSTIQDVSAAFYAVLPIPGGPDGGVITNGHGIQIAGLSGAATGSATTFTNFKAFDARAPAGNPATGSSWGVWSDPNFAYNYFGGSVKIGSTGGETTTYKLDVQGGDTKLDGNIFDNANTKFANIHGRKLYDNSSVLTEDLSNRQLLHSDGTTVSYDWQNGLLNDSLNHLSVDVENKHLWNSVNNEVIDWDFSLAFDALGNRSIDWANRLLYNTDGAFPAYDWAAGHFNSAGGATLINIGASHPALENFTGGNTVQWTDYLLLDSTGTAIDWNAHQLQANGNTLLDWSGAYTAVLTDAGNNALKMVSPSADAITLATPGTGAVYTMVLPPDMSPGNPGYVLQTDGVSATSWVDPTSFITGTPYATAQFNSGGSLTSGFSLPDSSGFPSVSLNSRALLGTGGGSVMTWGVPNEIVISEHIRSNSPTPSAQVNDSAGIGGTCAVSNATDTTGTVTLTTNIVFIGVFTGDVCDINFQQAYNTAPICTFSPNNVEASQAGMTTAPFFTTTASAMTINFGFAETTPSTYMWSYHCIETN